LLELLPEPEAMGLLALMLLQESRRAARVLMLNALKCPEECRFRRLTTFSGAELRKLRSEGLEPR
jgi:hypothetical protein